MSVNNHILNMWRNNLMFVTKSIYEGIENDVCQFVCNFGYPLLVH